MQACSYHPPDCLCHSTTSSSAARSDTDTDAVMLISTALIPASIATCILRLSCSHVELQTLQILTFQTIQRYITQGFEHHAPMIPLLHGYCIIHRIFHSSGESRICQEGGGHSERAEPPAAFRVRALVGVRGQPPPLKLKAFCPFS